MSTIEFSTKLNDLNTILHSFAYNLTKNIEDSKDLFQETAFRALKNKEKFKPGTNFKAWCFTIMKNIFINNYRKKAKANTIMDSTDNDFYINSGKNAVHNSAESNIMNHEISRMVDGLEDGIRIPFVMHFQGFKYQEISDYLELPLGTVKSRIFFARKELKTLLIAQYNSLSEVREFSMQNQ